MLDHFAVLDGDAPVHARREFHVVGGDERGEPRQVHELGERREYVVGGVRVEIAGRLSRAPRAARFSARPPRANRTNEHGGGRSPPPLRGPTRIDSENFSSPSWARGAPASRIFSARLWMKA